MLGMIGVLAALAILIYLALRGVSILIISVACAAVVALANGLSLDDALMGSYAQGLAGFVQAFFLLFLFGAIFGKIMGDSGAATSVAYVLSRKLGAGNALLISVLACAILSYGGVNVFILVFTVYPLGLALIKHANLPKRLLAGAFALGAGTFTMTALPGTPAIQNIIPSQALGTPATAAPAVGIVAAIVMFFLGYSYLRWQGRKAARTGDGFVPGPADEVASLDLDPRDMPHWLVSLVPLAVVVGIIVTASLLPLKPPLAWVNVGLAAGCVVGVVVFWRRLKAPNATLAQGAANSAVPLINTSAVIGFGAVVAAVPAFTMFGDFVMGVKLPPLVSAAFSVNVIAGLVGSASGGLRIFMETLGPDYVRLGVDPALLHRISSIASGGLDSLPHSGAVITTLAVMGMTHRDAYKEIFVVTVLVPLAALGVALLVALAL
ncbi:MAG: GntP family permease [Armatimonadota bacterium]|nr:MAG: GntP family permease [Armatimonadota bacterium]